MKLFLVVLVVALVGCTTASNGQPTLGVVIGNHKGCIEKIVLRGSKFVINKCF